MDALVGVGPFVQRLGLGDENQESDREQQDGADQRKQPSDRRGPSHPTVDGDGLEIGLPRECQLCGGVFGDADEVRSRTPEVLREIDEEISVGAKMVLLESSGEAEEDGPGDEAQEQGDHAQGKDEPLGPIAKDPLAQFARSSDDKAEEDAGREEEGDDECDDRESHARHVDRLHVILVFHV